MGAVHVSNEFRSNDWMYGKFISSGDGGRGSRLAGVLERVQTKRVCRQCGGAAVRPNACCNGTLRTERHPGWRSVSDRMMVHVAYCIADDMKEVGVLRMRTCMFEYH